MTEPVAHSTVCPVIVGPTAVGKTGLITSLAGKLPVEVISLDSRQIYSGLRIGTAQPTAEEQAVCPHHLVDFVSPEETYSAQRFREDFQRVFLEITSRGKKPILVGGAGLYLTVLQKGLMALGDDAEARLPEIREELDVWSDEAIRRELARVDPDSFDRIHANDRYRSQRALEIQRLTGRTMTELTDEQQPDPCLGLSYPTFVLERSVEELDVRIVRRTDLMLAGGWIEETETALAQHPANCPGLMSIGYREIVEFLAGRLTREDLAPTIVKVTRQYAKRQRTWFRHINAVVAGNPGSPELLPALTGTLTGAK